MKNKSLKKQGTTTILESEGNLIKKWLLQHPELLFWIAALGLLFFMETNSSQPSLCILKFIGFESCPGCGLGHAIHHAMHFNIMQSIEEHLFGIPALLIILLRVKQLFFIKKTNIYEI